MKTTKEVSETSQNLARVIRSTRAAKMVPLRDVAERAGISFTVLSRIERGQREIELGEFVAVAAALDIDPAEAIRQIV